MVGLIRRLVETHLIDRPFVDTVLKTCQPTDSCVNVGHTCNGPNNVFRPNDTVMAVNQHVGEMVFDQKTRSTLIYNEIRRKRKKKN
jgi:hypothetical protein